MGSPGHLPATACAMTHPGLILYNATVRTLDPRQPVAELVALEGGRITFVGSAGDLPDIRGPHTRLVDCQGGCLLPGFQDAHLHLLALASRLMAVDCSPHAAASIAQIKSALAQRAATTPRGAWIRGWAYDDWALEERRHPNRWDLDEAAPLHPVRLVHRSGHGTVLNSRALEAVGIGSETPDPPDGVIERGDHGEPTGLLLEMDAYLQGRIPRLAEHELDNGLRMADALLLAHGVTLVQDATPSNDVERWGLLRRLKERGLLTPRVVLMPGAAALDSFAEHGMGYGSGDEDLRLGPAKIMLTQTTGALAPSPAELAALAASAHSQGFPVAIHAVESEAVSAAALAIQSSGSAPEGAGPNRIEHASELPSDVLRQVAQSGATVVTNPGFLYFSGERYRDQTPPERQPWLYRIGALHRSGVPLAFGSDAPVELPGPLTEIYAAVTRRSRGNSALSPGEGIAAEDALRAHTLGGAQAAGIGGWVGTIAPGMAADLVLLDRDPCRVEPEALRELRVRMTLVGGGIAWEAPGG